MISFAKFGRGNMNFMKVRTLLGNHSALSCMSLVLTFLSALSFCITQSSFNIEYWGQVSADAKNLISSLLTVSPSNRLTADKALKHQWLSQSDDFLTSQDLGVNLAAFKKFNAKRKMKAAVKSVMAANKFTSLGLSAGGAGPLDD